MLDKYQLEEITEEFGPIPTHMEVCPTCGGTGRSLPESLSGDVTNMCREDPDFAEDYFEGHYDQTCRECHGKNVVATQDWARMPKAAQERMEEMEHENAAYRREVEAERRMGC